MKKHDKTYYFSPNISYKAFKAICNKLPDTGPTPKNIDKILWQMLKERKINIGIDNSDDPLFITRKLIPKSAGLIGDKPPPSNK